MYSAQGGREGQGSCNEDHVLILGWPLQFGELKSESESVSDVNSTFKGWKDAFQSESEVINQCDTGKDSKQAIAEKSKISLLLCQDERQRKKSQADGIEKKLPQSLMTLSTEHSIPSLCSGAANR